MENRPDNQPTPTLYEKAEPRYDLSEFEIKQLENELVDKVTEEIGGEGLAAVWMAPDNKFTNILRTYEASYFPEVQEVSPEVEEDTLFLTIVDTRECSRRIVHATTISKFSQGEDETTQSRKTGFTTIDDLIEMGNFSAEDFKHYYDEKGIDLTRSISVDTNFRIGEKAPDYNGIGTVDLAYLTLFRAIEHEALEDKRGAVFASINRASIISFGRVGIDCEALMGRSDLVTSEAERGLEYKPVAIPLSDSNREVFTALKPWEIPELVA